MAFPAFWEYVVISDPINCHKYVAKNSTFMIFFTIFPEYSEKSGEFDKNRETRRLHEFSGDSR